MLRQIDEITVLYIIYIKNWIGQSLKRRCLFVARNLGGVGEERKNERKE